jgi:hypothetical protein
MADMILLLDRRQRLRGRAMRALANQPNLFARLLATHTGEFSLAGLIAPGLSLAWRMLTL